MDEGTAAGRSTHRHRADDAHRRLLEEAAQRSARWHNGEVPTRVERVIVGGGLAATLAWATRANTEGTCVVLARAEEPWWSRREHRLGQPASELVSEGFVLQPHEFADDIDGFAPASALADAIAVTAHAHGMPLVLGCCVDQPIERTEDGRFVVHAGGRRIEAEHVDVAVGLGPARRLRDRHGNATIVTEEDERLLLADGRLVFGQDQWLQPVRRHRVLVIGGGATAAWNVELALRHGAKVTWLAPERVPILEADERLYRKARDLEIHLERRQDLPPERRRWLERARTRIVAFRRADLPRNRGVFRAMGVDWRVGYVERLYPRDDGVEAILRIGSDVEPLTQRFEQVVIAIGQNDYAAEASTQLVRRLPMTWLEQDGHDARPGGPGMDPSGRVVGACVMGETPRLRCLGVLLRSRAWKERLQETRLPVSFGDDALETRLMLQARAAPKHSRGIDGAIFQVIANVILANGVPLDPGLGRERYEWLAATLRPSAPQMDTATSIGVGG